MDISFFTSAGGDAWSLEECAGWAKENGFDAVRLSASGAVDPDRILADGPGEVNGVLKDHGVYLAALSAHNNLLDDDTQEAEAAALPAPQGHRGRFRTRHARGRHPRRESGGDPVSTASIPRRRVTRATGPRNWWSASGSGTNPS